MKLIFNKHIDLIRKQRCQSCLNVKTLLDEMKALNTNLKSSFAVVLSVSTGIQKRKPQTT